jgi:hypothetical protein
VQTWFTLPWLENHRFEFQKSRQLFIRVHNETLSVAAMCVGTKIVCRLELIVETQPLTPTGFADGLRDFN